MHISWCFTSHQLGQGIPKWIINFRGCATGRRGDNRSFCQVSTMFACEFLRCNNMEWLEKGRQIIISLNIA